MTIDRGAVVYCRFPTDEGGTLPHYALVLTVEETEDRQTLVTLAYGSSKKVSASGHLPHEFVIVDRRELLRVGLRVSTRFDLLRTAKLGLADIEEVTGSIDLTDRRVLARLKKAISALAI